MGHTDTEVVTDILEKVEKRFPGLTASPIFNFFAKIEFDFLLLINGSDKRNVMGCGNTKKSKYKVRKTNSILHYNY